MEKGEAFQQLCQKILSGAGVFVELCIEYYAKSPLFLTALQKVRFFHEFLYMVCWI